MPRIIPPTIVVVGYWNPAILQPHWLSANIYETPDGEPFPVQLAFATDPGTPPRFTVEHITYVPAYDKLTVSTNQITVDALNDTESKVISILEKLPHTPVRAFGSNFEIIEDTPSNNLLEVFNINDELAERISSEFTFKATSITSSVEVNNCVLNLTRQLSDQGIVTIKFNFHTQVTSALDAAARLRDTFNANFVEARNILNTYGVELTDIQEATGEQ